MGNKDKLFKKKTTSPSTLLLQTKLHHFPPDFSTQPPRVVKVGWVTKCYESTSAPLCLFFLTIFSCFNMGSSTG